MTIASRGDSSWPELHEAQRRVLLEVLIHGAQSRIELAAKVGLSRASLTRLARELVDAGLVLEGEAQASGARGRPREMLHLRPESAHFAGVKLTGDALYAVVTDLSATVVDRRELPLGSRDVGAVVELIASVTGDMLAGRARPAAIGVCLAGDVARRGDELVVERSAFLGWDAVPLTRLVGEATGLPSTVRNDVQALTGAEHWFGAGVGHRSLVVYGLGAGIGSGLVVRDDVVDGAHGRPGRVGHARMPRDHGTGRVCELGHDDCVHSFVTIPAIEHNAGVPAGEYARAIDAAHAGDDRALAAFRSAAFALGLVIAEAVDAIDPEKVLVMGEGVDMMALAPDELRRALADHLEQVDPGAVRIERPPFDFSNYARGAAVAAMRDLL